MEYNRYKRIEEKMNCQNFYDGVAAVNKIFSFQTVEDLLENWQFVKTYLQCYETVNLTLTDDGVKAEKIRPFQTQDDIEIAKFIMVSFFA